MSYNIMCICVCVNNQAQEKRALSKHGHMWEWSHVGIQKA